MQRRDDHLSLAPLFDAVAASPDDDAPRQVLSDALLERGDPRGEFILLQLLRARGKSTPKQEARERIFQENHWRRWFSEVPGVGLTPTAVTPLNDFHRGFLRSCVLSPCGVGIDSPSWRMIERIDLRTTGTAPIHSNALELAAPAFERLHALMGLDSAALQIVLAGPDKPCLSELGFAGPSLQADRGPREQQQVLDLRRFTTLRVLRLEPRPFRHHADWLGWLFEAPLLRQLERLTLWLELPFDVAGLQALLAQHRLEHLHLELASRGVQLHLTGSRLTVRFDDEFWLGQRAQAVRNLAPHFSPFPYRRFEVKIADRPATRDELQRLGDHFVTSAG